jgi:RimJ/RimL family protein N-acetyltransferase
MLADTFETTRLRLRPPVVSDIPALISLLDDYDIASKLERVPHPYSDTEALAYVARAMEKRSNGTGHSFAVTLKADGTFLGGCGVHCEDGVFDFGYWLGKPFWGRGYATEAVERLARFAFRDLLATQLVAYWHHDNPASGRVLAKLGCRPAGAQQRDCLARGHTVYCHRMTLDRENFERNRMP